MEIANFVWPFFDTSHFPTEINMTWVILITKVDEVEEIKQFRLSSMVGCLYKIIAKILANHMKKLMPILIREAQFAFVPKRQILDNALITNEVV